LDDCLKQSKSSSFKDGRVQNLERKIDWFIEHILDVICLTVFILCQAEFWFFWKDEKFMKTNLVSVGFCICFFLGFDFFVCFSVTCFEKAF